MKNVQFDCTKQTEHMTERRAGSPSRMEVLDTVVGLDRTDFLSLTLCQPTYPAQGGEAAQGSPQ